ncbi:MAG TPA: ABC transporter ATP-binding protein [Blastocatellia bacterium]|nr:ABC transporter ATP-binding protein [Blastocatellia bacterium]
MTHETRSIVELEQVTKDYGAGVMALAGITLAINSGERVGIMGPSGSGKSTLLNLACGLDDPTSGVVRFEGAPISKLSDDARTRLRRERIGMVFQTFNLLATLTAVENTCLPLRLQGLRRREAEKRGLEMLERVGLATRANHRPDQLSGGERQRVAIARALIFGAPLLLADEPTGNLDSATGEEILELLDGLNRDFGVTVLLVTHNTAAASHCDRVLNMRDGRVTAETQVKSRGEPAGSGPLPNLI